MATRKARQKRTDSSCICSPPITISNTDLAEEPARMCRYGRCLEWRCKMCNGFLAGFGPAGCKCDGDPRWMYHPGMVPGYLRFRWKPAAVKPSLAKRRK